MPTLQEILKEATFLVDEDVYHLLKLPPNAIIVAAGILAEIGEAFSALLVDKFEVTLVIESESYEEYKNRLRYHEASDFRYKLVTLEAELDPNIIGLTAVLSRALADKNIPIIPLGSFSRDHFLIPEEKIALALEALNALKQ